MRLKIFVMISLLSLTNCDNRNLSEGTSPESVSNKQSNSTQVEWRNRSATASVDFSSREIAWISTAANLELVRIKNNNENQWIQTAYPIKTKLLDFIDETKGWLITDDNRLLATENGGEDWKEITAPHEFMRPQTIKFTDHENGWVTDENSLLKTSDGGKTWKKMPVQVKSALNLGGSYFLSSLVGWVCDTSESGAYLRGTRDGGITWSEYRVSNASDYPCEVSFSSLEQGYVAVGRSERQELFSTTNGGKTWNKETIPSGFEVRSMFWQSFDDGWLAGYYRNQANGLPMHGTGAILHTIDGGNKWNEIEVDRDVTFFDRIVFFDSDVGIATSSRKVYATDNRGANWRAIFVNDGKQEK